MFRVRLRSVVLSLAALVVAGWIAGTAATARSGLIALAPGQAMRFAGTYLAAANVDGEAVYGEVGCSMDKLAVGTYMAVSENSRTTAIGVVARGGSPTRLVKTYPNDAPPSNLPVSSAFPSTGQTAPTIDGPATELQAQVPLDGGNADQIAGFNAGFLGFPDAFVAAITVGADGNLVPGGHLVAVSPTRIEVETLGPGAQPDIVSQPFRILCDAVDRAKAHDARVEQAIRRLRPEARVSAGIHKKDADAWAAHFTQILQLGLDTALDLGACDYPAAQAEAPLMQAELRGEARTAARLLPQIADHSLRNNLQKDEKKMQAEGKATVQVLGQIIK